MSGFSDIITSSSRKGMLEASTKASKLKVTKEIGQTIEWGIDKEVDLATRKLLNEKSLVSRRISPNVNRETLTASGSQIALGYVNPESKGFKEIFVKQQVRAEEMNRAILEQRKEDLFASVKGQVKKIEKPKNELIFLGDTDIIQPIEVPSYITGSNVKGKAGKYAYEQNNPLNDLKLDNKVFVEEYIPKTNNAPIPTPFKLSSTLSKSESKLLNLGAFIKIGNVESSQIQISNIKPTTLSLSLQKEQLLNQIQSPQLKVNQIEPQNLKSNQVNIQQTKLAQVQVLKQMLKLKQVQVQQAKQKVSQTSKQNQIWKKIKSPPPPPPPPRYSSSIEKIAAKEKLKDIFQAVIRRRKQDTIVGEFGTAKEALSKVLSIEKGTLAAGGFISQNGKPIKIPSMFLNKEFTQGKKESFRVIQKREFRLGTGSEVREIKQAKRNSFPKPTKFKKFKL